MLVKEEPITGDFTVQAFPGIIHKVASMPKRLKGTKSPAHLEVVVYPYVPMPYGVKRSAGGLSVLMLFVNGISSSIGGECPPISGQTWPT